MDDGEFSKQLHEQIQSARQTLRAAGILCVQSGCLKGNHRRLWVHSEFGPAVQDKDTNQDYVIAWQDRGRPGEGKGGWAIVMADGVTSSYWAEWGAQLACWISLAELVEARSNTEPKELALSAILAAGESIGKMSDIIRQEPGKYRPDDEFDATWDYVLAEGLLLQTTLTVVWWDGELHIAIVGDGVVAVRHSADAACRTVAGSDLQGTWVHALGPNNQQVTELDAWTSLELTTPCLLTVFTDGVGRGVSGNVGELFACADTAIKDGETNPARDVLASLQQNRPEEFEDNLTLGLVHIER